MFETELALKLVEVEAAEVAEKTDDEDDALVSEVADAFEKILRAEGSGLYPHLTAVWPSHVEKILVSSLYLL